MHTDEAVHTVKAGILLDTHRYVYDPYEYHGPTHYYCALPFIWASGARTLADTQEWMFRIVPVIFGTALVLLVLGLADGLGWAAAAFAALLTALSPAMAFYSRYYIQEMLLVFFTLALLVCLWRYYCRPRWAWALTAGVALGAMHATKETTVIAAGAIVFATVVTALWSRGSRVEGVSTDTDRPARPRWQHLAGGLVLAALVSTTLLSAFFTNLHEPIDAVRALFTYIGRGAAGAGRADGAHFHDHPWHYYLEMLLFAKYAPGPWWSEAFIVALSVVGSLMAFGRAGGDLNKAPSRTLVRFLLLYTLFSIVVYSAIPYKTPWCMLSFLNGMILLAGVGAVALVRVMPYRVLKGVVVLALLAGAAQLGMQAYRSAYTFNCDYRNPYVYGHSASDVIRLGERMEALAAVDDQGHDLLIKIIAPDGDYWPMPWYLRRFTQVGYWSEIPEDPDAAVIIASTDLEEALNDRLTGEYMTEYYGLRPEVLITVFIRSDLWDEFIATRM